MNQRNESLDALRGFAILTMVLSGSMAFGDVLPAWMFHAQVPPPTHKFDPSIAGITWVDLVFPFFLFSMGAAIPLSMQKQIAAGAGFLLVLEMAARRFLLLAFFALFSQHMKAWVIASEPMSWHHVLSIVAFVLLFFQFFEYKGDRYKMLFLALKLLSFAGAVILLWQLPFRDEKGFDFYRSDIIIMVLANMAFFGTIIYFFTAGKPLLRLGILPFIMAIFFAAKEPGDSWAKTIFNFQELGAFRFDWLYKFYFLKYLFIIIPGTIAGEWMLQQRNAAQSRPVAGHWIIVVCLAIIVMNLYGLFARLLFINFVVTTLLCIIMYYLLRKRETTDVYRRWSLAGTYLLLLGLCFEAFEGGIKKDPSTYSYYFVTSGLAFFTLVLFSVATQQYIGARVVGYLSTNGKNPMVAYVAGSLLILPLLQLMGLKLYWDSMQQNAWMGFFKGVVFTAAVSLLTVWFVRRKWFWKT